MKSPTLRFYPDPCLASTCARVGVFDDSLYDLGRAMGKIMRSEGGVGLAANQLGVALRVIVVDAGLLHGQSATGAVEVLVNPVIKDKSGLNALEEGCLSLPGVRYRVAGRAERVSLLFQNEKGAEGRLELEGLAALCVQHEIDHLDGVTMLDRLSPLKASRAKAKLIKAIGAKR